MQLRGLHHVTAICRDLERTIAFYRDLLGLALVHDGPSDDDPELPPRVVRRARRRPGQLVSFMQYPELPTGVVGVGSTHHFALLVETAGRAGGLARLPARPRASSAPTSSTAARAARSTCAIPTATWSRSPPAGPASPAPAAPTASGRARRRRVASRGRPGETADGERVDLGGRLPPGARRGTALAVGHRADGLRLVHRDRREEAAATSAPPSVLAHQQIADRHALRLPGAVEHDVSDGQLAFGHLALELRSCQSNFVGLRQRLHVLRGWSCRDSAHETSPRATTPSWCECPD